MGRITQEPIGAFGAHARGRPGLATLAMTLTATFAALAYWQYRNVNGPVENDVGLLAFGSLAAAFLAGVLGGGMMRVGEHGGNGKILAARTVIGLKFAEDRFQNFWTHSPDCLFSVEVSETGRFTFSGINPAHERLTGLREADILGKSPEACLTSEVAASVSSRYRECLQCGRPVAYDETLDLPVGIRHWRTSLVPIRHPVSQRIVLILGSARDITRDRMANEELSVLNERLKTVVSSITDGYCILNADWRLTFANAAALSWAGKELSAVIGKSYKDVYTQDTLTGRTLIEAMERRKVVHEEMPSATQPGRWLKYNVYPTPDGGLALFFRDVTEIREARETLNNLPRQILASQENERRRIALELHDSTIQHIVAANLNLMRLGPKANGARKTACDAIQRSLDEALQELRVFTYLLHPPALRRDGLVTTLETFLDGFGRRAGLDVSVSASRDLDTLSDDLQHAIFRVVQEALSNTHRHAHANHVSVQARLIRGTLCLRVSDDGLGIRTKQDTSLELEDAPVGVGLRGMHARLKQFGGRLRVKSSREGRTGTTLVAVVPMARQARSLLEATDGDRSTTKPRQLATADPEHVA